MSIGGITAQSVEIRNPSVETGLKVLWLCGETGIHAVLRTLCSRACGFDSHHGHKNFILFNSVNSEKEKIEISKWETEQILDLMISLDCLLDDKEIQNNEYVKYHKKRMKKSLRKRTNSLINKMETVNNINVQQQQQQQSSREDGPGIA